MPAEIAASAIFTKIYFELTYQPGIKMGVADVLSRATCTVSKSEIQQELETICAVDSGVTDPIIEQN